MTQCAKSDLFWKLSSLICNVYFYFPPLETSSIYSRSFYSKQCPAVLHAKKNMGCIPGCTKRKQQLCFTLAQNKNAKTLHWLFHTVDCVMQLKKQKAENAPLKSPRYVVSIQLPGYTWNRHKATIVLIVFWDKYSYNCPFHLKAFWRRLRLRIKNQTKTKKEQGRFNHDSPTSLVL